MIDDPPELLVAPREIHDLVYRAARVFGVEPGPAHRLADNVAYCEIVYGGALAAVASSLSSDAVRELAEAPGHVMWAEVAASNADARIHVPRPLALCAVAKALADCDQRGWAVDIAPCDGSTVLDGLTLTRSPVAFNSETDARVALALGAGVAVNASAWSDIEVAATRFLVPETVLDSLLVDP